MNVIKWFWLFLMIFSLACNLDRPVQGKLDISFQFDDPKENIVPSYQTAIWLTDCQDSTKLYTLFVAEYLSYGGYNDSTICPNWSGHVDWDNVSDKLFDAVTQATPSIGENIISIDLSPYQLKQGKYTICIQTHVVDKENIMYKGNIDLKKNDFRVKLTPIDKKLTYESSKKVLNNVYAEFFK